MPPSLGRGRVNNNYFDLSEHPHLLHTAQDFCHRYLAVISYHFFKHFRRLRQHSRVSIYQPFTLVFQPHFLLEQSNAINSGYSVWEIAVVLLLSFIFHTFSAEAWNGLLICQGGKKYFISLIRIYCHQAIVAFQLSIKDGDKVQINALYCCNVSTFDGTISSYHLDVMKLSMSYE